MSAAVQFNAGSALAAGTLTALAFINTLCAAAAAMLTWVLVDNLRGHKLRATGVCVGAVVGLIAITPAAGTGCNLIFYDCGKVEFTYIVLKRPGTLGTLDVH